MLTLPIKRMWLECVGDEVLHNVLPEMDQVEWGAEPGKKYYILHIKKIERRVGKNEINRCRQAD